MNLEGYNQSKIISTDPVVQKSKIKKVTRKVFKMESAKA